MLVVIYYEKPSETRTRSTVTERIICKVGCLNECRGAGFSKGSTGSAGSEGRCDTGPLRLSIFALGRNLHKYYTRTGH